MSFAPNAIVATKVFAAMTIAGSDSSGGAGIQADLKTFQRFEVYGTSVLTALTAQNTQGVRAVYEVSGDFVQSQIEAVSEDIQISAVKTGMLHRAEVIESVVRSIQRCGFSNLVVDPVMVATSGDRLLSPSAVDCLKTQLIPLARLITPNIPEAEVLCGHQVANKEQIESAAQTLLELGCGGVLIKGGHLQVSESSDFLLLKDQAGGVRTQWLTSPQVETLNTHGTGCVLSAAITALLARGEDLTSAVLGAKRFLTQRLEQGRRIKLGRGHGPALGNI